SGASGLFSGMTFRFYAINSERGRPLPLPVVVTSYETRKIRRQNSTAASVEVHVSAAHAQPKAAERAVARFQARPPARPSKRIGKCEPVGNSACPARSSVDGPNSPAPGLRSDKVKRIRRSGGCSNCEVHTLRDTALAVLNFDAISTGARHQTPGQRC